MLEKLTHYSSSLMDLLGTIASGLLLLLVAIISYNVIARYAFSASSIGLEELSWHLYAAIFLLGIPFALKSGSHVRVDIFYENFSQKNKAIVDLIGCILFLFPTCLVIIWSGWNFTAAAYDLGQLPNTTYEFFQQLITTGIGEKSQDPGGLLNRWIIKGVIPLSFAFLLLASISFFLEKLNTLIQLPKAPS